MTSVLPEFLETEYRLTKTITRLALILAMAFPIYLYAPLIWKDGSYTGRWVFASDIERQQVECKTIAYVLFACEVKFVNRTNGRQVKLDYLVTDMDWNGMVTDIVRSTDGHLTGSVGVTKPGLFARIGAFGYLLVVGLAIEHLIRRIKFISLQRRIQAKAPATRNTDAVMLSRDRRDRY